MQRGLEMTHRLVVFALPHADNAEVVPGVGKVWPDLRCHLEMREGLIQPALIHERHGEIGVCHEIVLRHREGVTKKGSAAFPGSGLGECRGRQGDHHQEAGGRQGLFPSLPPRCQVVDSPGSGDKGTDERDIRIAVRHGSLADLYDADDGQQGDQVPEPPEQQIGKPARSTDSGERHGNQEQSPRQGLPGGDVLHKGVIDGQVCRPDHLDQVDKIRGQGIRDPRSQWIGINGAYGPSLMLGDQRDEARERRQEDQRYLFREDCQVR